MASLKSHLKRVLAKSPVWRNVTPWIRPQGVTVLMYHSIYREASFFDGLHADRFKEQMVWLKENCTILDPENIQEGLRMRDEVPVVITFDDGYKDYHDVAYPILEELEIPAIVFLTTSFHDDGGMIWTEQIRWAVENSPRKGVSEPWRTNSPTYDLRDASQRQLFSQTCKDYLKNIPDELRLKWQGELMDALDISDSLAHAPRRLMLWDEIRATARFTRFGAHSHSHPIMSQIPEDRVKWEVRTCTQRIEDETGHRPHQFAYPNGRPQDYNATVQRALRENGYDLAYTSTRGINGVDADLLELKRQPTRTANVADLAMQLLGSDRY